MKRLLLLILSLTLMTAVPAQQRKAGQKTATTTKKTTANKKTSGKKTVSQKTTDKKNAQKAQQKKGKETIKGLQGQRAQLQKRRQEQENKRKEVIRNVQKGMENLLILNGEIAQKQRTIDTIRTSINQLEQNIGELNAQLKTLKQELEERRQRYMKSMRYMRRNRSAQSRLLFIFSAEDFNQMYRRMRFMDEYADYQKAQGEAIMSKQEQVTRKQEELTESHRQMTALLRRGEREQQALEHKQDEQQTQVNTLRKEQKTIEAVIAQQQKEEAALDARIERLIAEEAARARAAAEAEAKRRAAEEARRKDEAARQPSSRTSRPSRPSVSDYAPPSADRRLTGSFASNKGQLPMPITGAYKIVRGFGQYTVEGLRNVRLNSSGIHLKGQTGAKARCVFDGVVSGVFAASNAGSYVVMVRHGDYISVYCNLTSVNVQKGQQVKGSQTLGALGDDGTMQFQLRMLHNWNDPLNPMRWLRR